MSAPRSDRPAALDRVGVTLEADLRSAGRARRLVSQALQNWDLLAFSDVATLLTSEVVTNAIQHAATPVHVTVSRRPGRLRIEVCDSRPARRVRPGQASPDDDHGRGLALLEELSSRWAVVTNGAMKCVWFELDG